jgi:hypothetical protein
LGTGTIEQTRGSPRGHAIHVRKSISTSIASVLARRLGPPHAPIHRQARRLPHMNLAPPPPRQKTQAKIKPSRRRG